MVLWLLFIGVNVRVTPPNQRVPEGVGTAEICVEIVSGQLAPGQAAVISFNTQSGSAIGKQSTAITSNISHFTYTIYVYIASFPGLPR